MINEIIHANNEQGCMSHSHTVQTVSNELSQYINVAKCESMPALTPHLCDTFRWPRSQAALTLCELKLCAAENMPRESLTFKLSSIVFKQAHRLIPSWGGSFPQKVDHLYIL